MVLTWTGHHFSALNPPHIQSTDVYCSAAAGGSLIFLLTVGLQAPDAAVLPGWQDLQFVSNAETAVYPSAGDDRAKTSHGEHPVDGQTRTSKIGAAGSILEQGCQRTF